MTIDDYFKELTENGKYDIAEVSEKMYKKFSKEEVQKYYNESIISFEKRIKDIKKTINILKFKGNAHNN